MPFDVDALLSLAECGKPRKPKELREWALAKCNEFAQIPELREPVLLHERPFKWFHEEIYPLSVFAIRRYGDRDDVFCVPKQDHTRDIDAEIHEPSRTIHIEITGARNPSEHLRMAYLVEHGQVSFTGGLKIQGTKRTGCKIENWVECVDHQKPLARHLRWIKAGAERKAGRGRYGKTYELLIAVEDWWFDAEDGLEVTNFIEREVLRLPLEFGAVHIVGITGSLFLSFLLLRGETHGAVPVQ